MAAAGSSDDARGFLQYRLALFGRVMAAMFVAFITAGNLTFQWIDPRLTWVTLSNAPPNHLALAVTAISLLVWAVCRRGHLELRTLQAIDTAAFVTTGLLFVGLGLTHVVVVQRDMTLILSLVGLMIGRTVIVPSSARRSLVLGLVLLPIAATAVYLRHAALGAQIDARIAGVTAAIWLGCTVFMSTIASGVIFGLRRQVRDMRKLGQYRLLEKLGEGGMGTVHRAQHALLRRPTAIKLIRPELAGERALARFEREVRLTGQLSHPNIVTVYDYGRTIEGVFYYAMEYVAGVDLERLVRVEGPQPVGRVVRIMAQLAGALAEAHRHGLVHRDVKPGNVMIELRPGLGDWVKLLDFGLVKPTAEAGSGLTLDTSVVGTPAYLAPEALTNPEGLDGRSDLYALGAVAFFLLTGRPPFEGRTVAEICAHHLHTAPRAPSELDASVPPELDALVLACLAKSPLDRPQSAADVLVALGGISAPWRAVDAERRWFYLERMQPTTRGVVETTAPTVEVDGLSTRTPPNESGTITLGTRAASAEWAE